MDVVSLGPLRVASTTWQPRSGAYALTVICKATFDLRPGQATLSRLQDYPNDEDNHWNDDPRRSLYSASDMAPFKLRADVLLVGEAYAPGGSAVGSLTARLMVGAVDKSIDVLLDRHFDATGKLVEGARFARMSLRYERTAQGSDNPVGVPLDAAPDRYGRRVLPNLQPPGRRLTSPGDAVEATGYGPVATGWPARRRLLGRSGASWLGSWRTEPMPADVDASFFNAAPADQRVDEIRRDELIALENLHPEHPSLVTRLPGSAPRAFVEEDGREVVLRGDTLWIDTTRGVCTVTWRGRLDLARPDEPGRVLVALEGPGQSLTWARVANLAATEGGDGDPLTRRADHLSPSAFDDHTAVGVPPAHEASGPATVGMAFDEHTAVGVQAADARPLPFQPGSRRPRRGPNTMAIPAPPVPEPVAQSPWARPSDGAPATPPPVVPAVPAIVAADPIRALADAHARQSRESVTNGGPEAQPLRAHAPAVPEVVELTWFDLGKTPELRRHREWQPLIAEPEEPEQELDFDEEPPPPPDPEVVARRDYVTVITQGRPVAASLLDAVMSAAVDVGGHFEPPLVLLAGKLAFPFDELETLKATVAAVSPLAPGRPDLEASLATVNDLLATPWLESSPDVAQGLTDKLRGTFKPGDRGLDRDQLDQHVERTLLGQRAYQRRDVFGDTWIRALLTPAGGKTALPAYLPNALAKQLPMFTSFGARVIAEAHAQQDQYESHPSALKVLALGRVLRLKGSGR